MRLKPVWGSPAALGVVSLCAVQIVVASHHAGKREEFKILLEEVGMEPLVVDDMPEPEETATTFLGNAAIKATAAAKHTGKPCIADDTGLVIADIPSGGPGIRARPLAEKHGGWEEAMKAICTDAGLLDNPRALVKAHFVSAMSMAMPDGQTWAREASVDGRLRWPPRGEPEGFIPIFSSYDPLRKAGVLAHRRAAFDKLWPIVSKSI